MKANQYSVRKTLIFFVLWAHVLVVFLLFHSNHMFVWKDRKPLIVKQVKLEVFPKTKQKERKASFSKIVQVKKESAPPVEEKKKEAKLTEVKKEVSVKPSVKSVKGLKVEQNKKKAKGQKKRPVKMEKKVSKEENVLEKNLDQALSFLQKIEEKEEVLPQENLLKVPVLISSLNIQATIEDVSDENHFLVEYQERLVEDLKNGLQLLEYGEVKLRLVIECSGRVKEVEILSAQSQKNKNYLKNELLNRRFSWWSQFFTKKNDQSFTITFRNE